MTTWIKTEDFGEAKKHRTYVIKCPGLYKLKDNISFYPKKNGVSAISIESIDVVLDLDGKVLKQSSRSKQTQITGITVKSGVHNVTLLGSYGSIKNFSQRGIYVQGGSRFITIGDNTSLKVTGCGYKTPTALLDGTKGIIQCGVQLGDTEFFAKFGFEVFHGLIESLNVTNLTVSSNCNGLLLGEGSEYKFSNCDISFNKETRLINPLFGSNGFFINNSVVCYGLVYFSDPILTPTSQGISNVTFSNCWFNNNSADASNQTVAGGSYIDSFIMAVNFRNLTIENCEFNLNETKVSPVSKFSQTRGLVLGGGNNTIVENTEFCSNKGGNYVSGFNQSGLISQSPTIFQGKSITLRNCVASGNIAAPTTASETTPFPATMINAISAVGFQIRYASGLVMTNCIGEDNRVILPGGQTTIPLSALADGILIFSDRLFPCQFSNNIQIENAKLSKNRVLYDCCSNNYNVTSSGIRVYDDLCENILIDNCFISGNLPGIGESPYPLNEPCCSYTSAGIDLFNNSTELKTGPSYISVTNNEIQNNGNYGVYSNLDFNKIQNNRISYHDIGVLLDLGSPITVGGQRQASAFSSILDNTFVLNSLATVDAAVTVAQPVSSLVAGNKAFSYAGTGGAFIPSNPPPVVSGNLSVFPPVSTFSWNNIDIENTQNVPNYPLQSCVIVPPSTSNISSSNISANSVSKLDAFMAKADSRKALFLKF